MANKEYIVTTWDCFLSMAEQGRPMREDVMWLACVSCSAINIIRAIGVKSPRTIARRREFTVIARVTQTFVSRSFLPHHHPANPFVPLERYHLWASAIYRGPHRDLLRQQTHSWLGSSRPEPRPLHPRPTRPATSTRLPAWPLGDPAKYVGSTK